jgi:hypothetical protein
MRRGKIMKIQELIAHLQAMNPEKEAFVARFTVDGTSEIFEIEEFSDHEGNAQLEIYAEEENVDEEEDEDTE